jgi:hypothetical protein
MAELKRGGKLLLFVELDFSWRKRESTPVTQNVRQALRTKCLSHGYSRNPDNTKR